MDAATLRGILQSDMKLWDAAITTEEDGSALTKVLDLPYGIGHTEVRLEGITDGAKRRDAVQSFGNYIRGVVEDAIGEESVTARAAQAAARVSEETDSGVDGRGQLSGPEAAQEDGQVTVPAFDVITSGHSDPSHRLADLKRGVIHAKAYIDKATREIAALEAYEEIMNASAHKKTPQPVKGTTSEGED